MPKKYNIMPYLNSRLSVKEDIWEGATTQVWKVPATLTILNYYLINKLLIFNSKCIPASEVNLRSR